MVKAKSDSIEHLHWVPRNEDEEAKRVERLLQEAHDFLRINEEGKDRACPVVFTSVLFRDGKQAVNTGEYRGILLGINDRTVPEFVIAGLKLSLEDGNVLVDVMGMTIAGSELALVPVREVHDLRVDKA